MVTYTPRSESVVGSACSGTDGQKSRTYTLANSSAVREGMNVFINGTQLHYGASLDYTFSTITNAITFLNNVYDSDNISLSYFISVSGESTGTQYCSTLEVFEYLRWVNQIPNYPTTTTLEAVDSSGTLASGSKIYLDHGKVIDGTQTISYGTTPSSVTALTETTDYTIDNEKGQITITATGAGKILTNYVYATYKYSEIVEDSFVSDLIDRASKEIEKQTQRKFGATTQVVREEQGGRGSYVRLYRPRNLKPYIIKTQLAEDMTAAETDWTLDDTTGLEAGDYLTVNGEVVSIDSVDSGTVLTVTRGALGTTATTHSTDDWCINMVVEVSNTPQGTNPTWYVMDYRKNFDADSDTGAVQLLHVNAEDKDDLSSELYPLHRIFNRIRITYKYGEPTVPYDIKKACILMVGYDLMLSGMAKSLPEGINGFNPSGHDKILDQIERILKDYKVLYVDGY